MGGGQRRQRAVLHPRSQRRIARMARFGLEIAGSNSDLQHRVANAQLSAKQRHYLGLISAFRAQLVIDRRRLDPQRQRGSSEHQQRHTVRPARNRKAQLRLTSHTFRPDRGAIVRESLDQIGREPAINCISLRCGSRRIASSGARPPRAGSSRKIQQARCSCD